MMYSKQEPYQLPNDTGLQHCNASEGVGIRAQPDVQSPRFFQGDAVAWGQEEAGRRRGTERAVDARWKSREKLG